MGGGGAGKRTWIRYRRIGYKGRLDRSGGWEEGVIDQIRYLKVKIYMYDIRCVQICTESCVLFQCDE